MINQTQSLLDQVPFMYHEEYDAKLVMLYIYRDYHMLIFFSPKIISNDFSFHQVASAGIWEFDFHLELAAIIATFGSLIAFPGT